jgi:ketosteroid isomerase-like protein
MRGNRRYVTLAGTAALMLSLSGCQKAERQEPAGNAAMADTSAIADAIKADEKAWSDEFQNKARTVDTLTSHYASDAFFIAPGVGPTTGIADIRKAYEAGLKDPNFTISFAADKVDVAQSGDVATSHGRFSETYTDPATKKAKTDSGTFLTVYRKQTDGSWKAVEDWAVADPAPAGPTG